MSKTSSNLSHFNLGSCEVCKTCPAEWFGYFPHSEAARRWLLICRCTNDTEESAYHPSTFDFDGPALLNHLQRKQWFHRSEFDLMMRRLVASAGITDATGKFAASILNHKC
jgi:hypothetical protein